MKLTVTLLTILVLAASGQATKVQSSRAVNKPAGVPQTAQAAIEFGHEGGNLKPYKIAIFENGRIAVIEGLATLKVQSISPDKVKELVRKASGKDFWKQSHINQRPALPDFGFVFVRVRTPAGKLIYHHGAKTGRLGEFYSELSDLVLDKP